MATKVKGMQELIDTLEKMQKVGDKTANNALIKAGKEVKQEEVQVAQRVHDEHSENVGWKEIKRYPIKTGKKGGKFVNIGIRASVSGTQKKKENADKEAGVKRATHWDKIKGLWYNHYGFFHNKTGRYVAGSHWMDTAYENSAEKAYKIVREEIEKDLGL